MPTTTVAVEIDATPDQVWAAIEPVERHVEWMSDAESIEFHTHQTRGVGTTFRCVTRFGPVRLADEMEITEWLPGQKMGVRHVGVVTGSGRFSLTPIDLGRRTRFEWTEELRFPAWLAGRLGAGLAARTLFPLIWRRNLSRLRRLIERRPA